MSQVERARVKIALGRHYARQRAHAAEAATPETLDALASAMVAQDAAGRAAPAPRAFGARATLAFVATQARFVPAWTWAAQACLVAAMALVAANAGPTAREGFVQLAVGLLAALSVLAGVPACNASRAHGVAELEYACVHNAAGVAVARMVVLGCTLALAVALMVANAAACLEASAFAVALWACPPFFASCAGSLALLRRVRPQAAAVACAGWTLCCCAVLLVLSAAVPNLYDQAALAVWAVAACAALAWLAREARGMVRSTAAGLDACMPRLQPFNL